MNIHELTGKESCTIDDEFRLIALIKKEHETFVNRLKDIVLDNIADEIKIHIVSDFDWKDYYSFVDNTYSCSINEDDRGFAPYCTIHDHSELSFKD